MSGSTAIATTGIADNDRTGAPAAPEPVPDKRLPAPRVTVGRFAPSPTGELHLGSLVAAIGSFLCARSRSGRWLLRMEDVDRTREVLGAADRILRTLDAFGLHWDGPVEYQSRRTHLYQAALERLQSAGTVYRCSCSRSTLARLVLGSDGEPVYPGTCRRQPPAAGEPCALRFCIGENPSPVSLEDGLQGSFTQDVAATVGDFVIRRRDGLFAYQLAVVVDDAEQQVTQVVRGLDLLDNTPRQILLQRALRLPTPEYMHLPLVVEPDGTKLAKKARSIPLDPQRAPELLFRALSLLGQAPPDELRSADLGELWLWARQHWSLQPLRGLSSVRV